MGIVHAKTVSADRKDDIFVKFNKLPVQVQRVIVDGLTRTKDDVIVKEIKTLLGAKTFDELVQLSYNAKVKMEKLGLFENVVIAIDVSKDKRENGYEVMFEVQEFRRVDGGVQTTFGDNDGCLDFQIKMPNMLGRGEQFSLVYTLGTRKTQKYSASFQKPLNNNPDLFFGWTAYQFHGDFPWSGYQETDKGTAFSFTFRTLMGSHSLQWEGIWRDLRALSRDTSFAVREQSGNSLKSSVKHTFSIDSRDDTVLPTAGTLWQTSQEYSGLGGNVEYAKQNGTFQWNISLPWDTVFQVSLAGGIMKSLDPQASVAICDKFFLGGPLTLRGFSLKSCGPHSHDDALGAESYWLAAAHIYSPLPFRPAQGRFGDLFKAHFFINAGNLGTMDFHNLSSSVCQMASTLRWSYGLGIVLCMSGTARLELNYVIPMRIQKGDNHLPRKDNLTNGVYACTCMNCSHFFKFRALQNFKSNVSFTINGTQYTAGNEYNPATSLNDFMRLSRVSMGTKGSCYEGGCGVCLVTVKLYEPVSQQYLEYAVNSCCLQLFTCDGFEITTIEGLGNPRKGLHVIQERLVQHDGTQCGYCSPSQVMNMYSLLQRNPVVTVQQIEDEFDAVICRCTGYRAILDAMKSFAVDAPQNVKGKVVDIEDLDAKLCKKTGKSCNGHCKTTGHNDHSCSNQINKSVHIVGANGQWFKPTSLNELQQILLQYVNANYRLIFGNTGFGLYQEIGPWNYDILIDIRSIQELYQVNLGSTIVLGANLSLQNLMDIFEQKATDPTVPYASAFVEHLKITAHQGIRNMSSWAGNLMLKLAHPEFPSDIFVLLETVSAQLTIVDASGGETTSSCADFLSLDMKGKVIISASLPTYSDPSVQVRTYKTSHRLQASQAFVNAGFNFDLDARKNFLVKRRPSIVIQGISSTLTHAVQTETFLVNKALGDPAVLQGALSTLNSELTPDTFPLWADPSYRKSLAVSMFYKFVLDVCQSKADARYVSGGQGLVRTPIVGTHDYDTDKAKWPLTEPMQKITAPYLATGVVQYLDDLPLAPGELCASVVISKEGNATIDTVDASVALSLPGVVTFIQASDIPADGVNNWRPVGIFGDFKEELLSTGTILYAGQPIGIVVADLQTTADTAAALVKVTYKNVQPPLVDIQTAIQQKSFFPNPPPPVVSGNAAAAVAASAHQISGSVGCGSQYQFHLEPQLTICTPTDVGGMKVKTTTQWIDGSLESVAQILGLPESDVTVEVERLGGAFGGKITQNFLVSGLCALAAHVVGRTVKMRVDIHTNMKMLGKRTPYYAEYQVGSDKTGKLAGVIITLYGDEGWGLTDVESSMFVQDWFDNAYYCPNWLFTPVPVKTNKPVNTGCRAPGSAPFIFVMESIMEHLAKSLLLDPVAVKQLNLYTSGQKDPAGMILNYCTIREIVTQLTSDINYSQRLQAVNDFNKANRWKKRGLALMPMRFAIMWSGSQFNSHVIIHHGDGSVSVAHGGIDVGQGINTKIIQVCAYELGIPMSLIRVKTSSSTINANSYTTGGSITTELCCVGVIESCRTLKDRMAPVKAAMGGNPSWGDLVNKCYQLMINLTASYVTHTNDPFAAHYSSYSATCAEAELDVLTGQYQLLQMDMLYDCGDSMNPELDIGQVEGGFTMGLGYFLQEDLKYDPQTGEMLTAGTWDYKPPFPKDLPMNMNFKFLKNAPNPIGVLGSKAVGEPPLVTAAACLFAIKHAVEAARTEISQDTFFSMSSPATVDKVQAFCLNNISDYTYGK